MSGNEVSLGNSSVMYETRLLEHGGMGNGPTEGKTIVTFEILDRLIPHFGIFANFMKLCRNELYDAIYSKELTGSSDSNEAGSQYIQHLPFFVLVNRLLESRDEKREEVEEKLEQVEKELTSEKTQHDVAKNMIADLETLKLNQAELIENLEKTCKELTIQVRSLEMNIERINEANNEKEMAFNVEIIDLKTTIDQLTKEANYLQTFKDGYDRLQYGVQSWDGSERKSSDRQKNDTFSTKKGNILADLNSCHHLEAQILSVQNSIIEEFDRFVESLNSSVKFDFPDKHSFLSISTDKIDGETEDDHKDHRLKVMQEKFQKNIEEIDLELSLLTQHKHQLHQQLEELEASHAFGFLWVSHFQGSNGSIEEVKQNICSKTMDKDSLIIDPFTTQERILNKYSAMLYTSDNNGKTYFEFKDANFCSGCGEKTVICPHKILNQEHVFVLPRDVTHIKLIRPKVRINRDRFDDRLQENLSSSKTRASGRRLSSRFSSDIVSVALAEEDSRSTERKDSRSISVADIYYLRNFQSVWEDFRRRSNVQRMVTRPLNQDRMVSMIKQFISYLLDMDNLCSDEDERKSVLDNLYKFLTDRYVKPSTTFLAAHDLLSALDEHQYDVKILWLFAQVLVGNLDASTMRYILLVSEMVASMVWKQVEDFRMFAKIIYPFLSEDDLETLHIGYVSFSENKLSESLVIDYVIYTIMKYREPRLLELESVLLSHPGKELSMMTETEFIKAADEVLSMSYDKLQRHLYREAAACIGQMDGLYSGVPVLRLAQITSYLNLLGSANRMKKQLKQLHQSV